jgi:hypothetical protein
VRVSTRQTKTRARRLFNDVAEKQLAAESRYYADSIDKCIESYYEPSPERATSERRTSPASRSNTGRSDASTDSRMPSAKVGFAPLETLTEGSERRGSDSTTRGSVDAPRVVVMDSDTHMGGSAELEHGSRRSRHCLVGGGRKPHHKPLGSSATTLEQYVDMGVV